MAATVWKQLLLLKFQFNQIPSAPFKWKSIGLIIVLRIFFIMGLSPNSPFCRYVEILKRFSHSVIIEDQRWNVTYSWGITYSFILPSSSFVYSTTVWSTHSLSLSLSLSLSRWLIGLGFERHGWSSLQWLQRAAAFGSIFPDDVGSSFQKLAIDCDHTLDVRTRRNVDIRYILTTQ